MKTELGLVKRAKHFFIPTPKLWLLDKKRKKEEGRKKVGRKEQ
jgi:hypothetical protein